MDGWVNLIALVARSVDGLKIDARYAAESEGVGQMVVVVDCGREGTKEISGSRTMLALINGKGLKKRRKGREKRMGWKWDGAESREEESRAEPTQTHACGPPAASLAVPRPPHCARLSFINIRR